MKKVNDPKAFSWIDQDLIFRYSDRSISDFLKMTSVELLNHPMTKSESYDPAKELTKEDIFNNVFSDLKKVKAEIY